MTRLYDYHLFDVKLHEYYGIYTPKEIANLIGFKIGNITDCKLIDSRWLITRIENEYVYCLYDKSDSGILLGEFTEYELVEYLNIDINDIDSLVKSRQAINGKYRIDKVAMPIETD